MAEAKGAIMTDQEIILRAIGRAHDVLAAYIEPGARDSDATVNRLLAILDDGEVVEAHERLTWETKRPPHPEGRGGQV